jgi:hypothetical protein
MSSKAGDLVDIKVQCRYTRFWNTALSGAQNRALSEVAQISKPKLADSSDAPGNPVLQAETLTTQRTWAGCKTTPHTYTLMSDPEVNMISMETPQ